MFTFTKDCLIGVPEIDDEHKRLFELIADVNSALESNSDSISTAMGLLKVFQPWTWF